MAGIPDVYMRFSGVDGDCLDELHPGKKDEKHPALDDNGHPIKAGWFTITNFSFGAGWGGSSTSQQGAGRDGHGRDGQRTSQSSTAGAHHSQSSGTDGTLNFDPISFSKAADSASIPLLGKCYGDRSGKDDPEKIEEVVVEACRPSGIDRSKKVPFLRLTFKDVKLKTAATSVAEASLPTENYTFEFATVLMEYIWTDNSTGERVIDQPSTAFWDKKKPINSYLRRPTDGDPESF